MEAKSFLKQINKLDRMISNKLIEQEQWKAIALGVTARMDTERVQSSGSKQKMADAIDKCVDLGAEIDERIDELIAIKKDVIAVIERLNVAEYELLHLLYVQNKPFDEVADILDKSKSWISTVHGVALQNVQRILDERENNGVCD